MVRQLKKFPAKSVGRPRVYNWSRYLDGNIWKLTRGVDFFSECSSFRGAVYSAASRAGLKVRVNVDGDAVTVQRTGKA